MNVFSFMICYLHCVTHPGIQHHPSTSYTHNVFFLLKTLVRPSPTLYRGTSRPIITFDRTIPTKLTQPTAAMHIPTKPSLNRTPLHTYHHPNYRLLLTPPEPPASCSSPSQSLQLVSPKPLSPTLNLALIHPPTPQTALEKLTSFMETYLLPHFLLRKLLEMQALQIEVENKRQRRREKWEREWKVLRGEIVGWDVRGERWTV